jgi:hypothetical protein
MQYFVISEGKVMLMQMKQEYWLIIYETNKGN